MVLYSQFWAATKWYQANRMTSCYTEYLVHPAHQQIAYTLPVSRQSPSHPVWKWQKGWNTGQSRTCLFPQHIVWARYCLLPSRAHLLLQGPVWRFLSPAGYSHGRCCPGRLNFFPQRLISTLKWHNFTWSNPTGNNHTNTIKCQPSQSSCGHFLATLR